ncbi:MAG: FAD-dependent oxidoreductase [Lachnospiraceae bacterium]|nr:FAD-dependent oxidoreductase [Lachnospiraceae bacterium]
MNIVREDSYDFVVCGGGMSGFAAAVSAAKKGLSVAIIECTGTLGGTAASAGIDHLLGGRKLNEETKEHVRVVGGLFDELTDHLIGRGEAIEPNSIDLTFNPFGWYPRMASGIVVDETALKIALDEFCEKYGVRVYFFTVLAEAELSGNAVTSVIVCSKDGFVRIRARVFADCTGDADLCKMAGCPVFKGRDSDGLMTPCSLEMHVENVDAKELVSYQNAHQSPKLVEIIDRLREEGIWTLSSRIFVTVRMMKEDVFMVNTSRLVMVDGTDEESVSRAIAEGRKQNLELFRIMKAHFPGFQNARIRRIYDYLGVRETRRIDGRYFITIGDALSGKQYDDCVAATTYNFDLPDPVISGYDPMMGDTRNPNAVRRHIVIQVPYRALLPKGIDNLIAAGRCVGADRDVMGALRVIGPCMMMGQAAGTAAALAVRNAQDSFPAVSTEELRKTLWEDGVLDPAKLPFD